MSIKTPGKKHGDTSLVTDIVPGDVFCPYWPLDDSPLLYLRMCNTTMNSVANLATGGYQFLPPRELGFLVDCKLVVKGGRR